MNTLRVNMVGFPDFWQKAHDVNPLAFNALLDLVPLQDEMFRRPVRGQLALVLRHIARVCINSVGALTTLLLNGYGNDGMKIARSMFEAAVNAAYLQKNPGEVTDYIDFHHVRVKRELDYVARDPVLAKAVTPEKYKEVEAEYKRVAPRFANKKGKVRSSWCRKKLAEMAAEVGQGDHYKTFYAWASAMHHVDFGGLSSQSDDTGDIVVAPSLEWLEIALITGHVSALRVLDMFNDAAQLGFDEKLKSAVAAFHAAWKKPFKN